MTIHQASQHNFDSLGTYAAGASTLLRPPVPLSASIQPVRILSQCRSRCRCWSSVGKISRSIAVPPPAHSTRCGEEIVGEERSQLLGVEGGDPNAGKYWLQTLALEVGEQLTFPIGNGSRFGDTIATAGSLNVLLYKNTMLL